MTRLGSTHGGWWIPQRSIRPGAIAYCAGAGEDISFDLALHDAGMHVYTFDPTPRAIAYVERTAPRSDRFYFSPVGWWDSDAKLKFYAPKRSDEVSHSALNLQGTTEFFEASVLTVLSITHNLGHNRVDLMKMDIEGAEMRVIPHLLSTGIRPTVLCVEFDQPQSPRIVVRTIRRLLRNGYTLRKVEKWNYTFEHTTATSPESAARISNITSQ